MRRKTALQKRACMMRKRGCSINEIYRELGVAKSSVSVWVRNVELSPDAQNRIQSRWTKGQHLAHTTLRLQTYERLNIARKYGVSVIEKFPKTKEAAQIICSLLYWCEGEKSKDDRAFSFVNSDPALVKTFLHLLRFGFGIDERKLRACVHLHSYHDKEKQLQFWSKMTNIPRVQFTKPYQKSSSSKRIREGYAGCISIRYYDVKIARQVQGIARTFLEKHGSIS